MIGWHRKGFRLFWCWKSEAGRRPIPLELQQLIRKMARENPSWGEERIANELLLKLGLCVSPRTIRKYLPKLPAAPPGRSRGGQRWATFLKNHARVIIACDFYVAVTATFRILYVLVVMEHASRRLIHLNATAHPTAAWTLQQLRETLFCRQQTCATKVTLYNFLSTFSGTHFVTPRSYTAELGFHF